MATSNRLTVSLVVVLALSGLLVGGYAFFAFVSGQVPRWTSAERVCSQPESIEYDTAASYEVVIREPSRPLSLNAGPSHAVVSRAGDGSYGVYVELNDSGDPRALSCKWTPTGVTITESNGIEHTIPSSVFTGGR